MSAPDDAFKLIIELEALRAKVAASGDAELIELVDSVKRHASSVSQQLTEIWSERKEEQLDTEERQYRMKRKSSGSIF